MSDEKLFKLESTEEIIRMKAIYRFIRSHGKTPEQVIAENLTGEEKQRLALLQEQIITESIKPFIEADLKKKEREERKEQKRKKFKKKQKRGKDD